MAYDKNNGRPNRKGRKKVCSFCVDKVESIDYKDVNKLNKYVSLIYEVSIVSPSLQQSLYHFVLSVSRLVPTHSQTSVSIHDDSNDLNDLPVNHLSHNQSIRHTYSNNTHFK